MQYARHCKQHWRALLLFYFGLCEITEPAFLQTFSYIFLGFGIAMIALTLFGYLLSLSECRKIVLHYVIAILILMLGQLIAYIVLCVINIQCTEKLEELLDKSVKKYHAGKSEQSAWDAINTDYKCCGKDNYKDFQDGASSSESPDAANERRKRGSTTEASGDNGDIPKSCCMPDQDCSKHYTEHNSYKMEGCYHNIEHIMEINRILMFTIGVVFPIIKIVLLIIGCVIYCKIRDGKCVCPPEKDESCHFWKCLTKQLSEEKPCITPVENPRPETSIGDCPDFEVHHQKPKKGSEEIFICKHEPLPVCSPTYVDVSPAGEECTSLPKENKIPCPPPKEYRHPCPPKHNPCPVKVCPSDNLTLPIVLPKMDDVCCLETRIRSKEMQILYLHEKQLLEHKLHHRDQMIWNQEQFHRKEIMKREQQIQFKLHQMATDYDLEIRDNQARMDRQDMLQEREIFQQEERIARTRQQLLMQREIIGEEADEASQRRAKAFNICTYRPLTCPDFGFIRPEIRAKNPFIDEATLESLTKTSEDRISDAKCRKKLCGEGPACNEEQEKYLEKTLQSCLENMKPCSEKDDSCNYQIVFKKDSPIKTRRKCCIDDEEVACKEVKCIEKKKSCPEETACCNYQMVFKKMSPASSTPCREVAEKPNDGQTKPQYVCRRIRSGSDQAAIERKAPIAVKPIVITSNPMMCDCECHMNTSRDPSEPCDFCDCKNVVVMKSSMALDFTGIAHVPNNADEAGGASSDRLEAIQKQMENRTELDEPLASPSFSTNQELEKCYDEYEVLYNKYKQINKNLSENKNQQPKAPEELRDYCKMKAGVQNILRPTTAPCGILKKTQHVSYTRPLTEPPELLTHKEKVIKVVNHDDPPKPSTSGKHHKNDQSNKKETKSYRKYRTKSGKIIQMLR